MLTHVGLLLSILGGLLFGIQTGTSTALVRFDTSMKNCTAYETQSTCLAVERAKCVWATADDNSTNTSTCQFSDWADGVDCRFHSGSKSQCDAAYGTSSCFFDMRAKMCLHRAGWSAGDSSGSMLVTGSLLVGAVLGVVAGGVVADRCGRRPVLVALAALGALSAVAEGLSWQFDSLPALSAMRVLAGVAVGSAAAVIPLYTAEVASPEHVETVGLMFMVSITTGTFFTSLFLLAIDVDYHAEHNEHLVERFHLLFGVALLVASVLFVYAWKKVPESQIWMRRHLEIVHDTERRQQQQQQQQEQQQQQQQDASRIVATDDFHEDEFQRKSLVLEPGDRFNYSSVLTKSSGGDNPVAAATRATVASESASEKWPLWRVAGLAVTLAVVFQLTGASLLVHFGTRVCRELFPLLSERLAYVAVESLLWISTLATFLVNRFVRPRTAFLCTAVLASVACALIGASAMPSDGLGSGTASIGVGAAGWILCAVALHAAVAPCFFLLASCSFLPAQRDLGCALTQASQFVLNLVIATVFPTAIANAFEEHEGRAMAIAFFAFAGCGILGMTAFSRLAPAELQFVAPPPRRDPQKVAAAERDVHEEATVSTNVEEYSNW